MGQGPARFDSRNGQQPVHMVGPGRRPPSGPSGSGAQVGRQLRVMNTDEELEHLAKRQRVLELRMTVQRTEAEAVREESQTAEGARLPQAGTVSLS